MKRRRQQWENRVVTVMAENSYEENRQYRRLLKKLAEFQKFSKRV